MLEMLKDSTEFGSHYAWQISIRKDCLRFDQTIRSSNVEINFSICTWISFL